MGQKFYSEIKKKSLKFFRCFWPLKCKNQLNLAFDVDFFRGGDLHIFTQGEPLVEKIRRGQGAGGCNTPPCRCPTNTDIQGKPSRNLNSWLGSVLVSKHYRFVKQCWLVNITGLYRVHISEKYRFLPQRFNMVVIYQKRSFSWTINKMGSEVEKIVRAHF